MATRSERDGAPVLIWPVPIATTKSAIVVSSVSPERWLTIAVQPARRAISIAAIVSVTVPIWLSLMRTEFAAFSAIPRAMNAGFVTRRSSPTSWTLAPRRAVSSFQPAQSSSPRPSSSEMIGYFAIQLSQRSTISPESRVRPSALEEVAARHVAGAGPLDEHGAGRRVEGDRDVLAGPVAGLLDRPQDHLDGRLVRRQRRGEAALVALADRVAAVVEERP